MAEYCKSDNACDATAGQHAMVGMVISGRAARACDVCGKGRARWYCAADLAYLCERCDGAVHSANAVAGRHERVRLGPDGAPVKVTRTLPTPAHVKHDAPAAVSPPPAAHFNPRKRPRSIRRHKRSSFHASKLHGISSISIHESNHNYTYTNAGSILASTHGVMINNPRNDPDFIANIDSNELLSKAIIVKAEPYSPVDFGDQVKVPDHIDDDHLLEGLFDFRDLQDDDLFLHQVPIYNPLQKQELSRSLHGEQCAVEEEEEEEEEDEEKKPITLTITTPFPNSSSEANHCANTHSPEVFQDEDRKGPSLGLSPEEINGASSLARECKVIADQSIDPHQDICDLDQLDFDCVLDGDDEDSDDMKYSTPMDMDINSDGFMDECDPCHAITHADRFSEVSYIDLHGNCGMDDADGQYNGEHHASYVAGFNFDATGSESPRTWLCKVKVESGHPEQLGMIHSQHGDFFDDALLKEKLTGADSPNTFKLGLKLNFEDVLSSWSDRGTLWTDGQPPSQISNGLDFLGGCFVPETMSATGSEADGQLLVPVLNHNNKRTDSGAREASVLRYREKRRTRLFSKKIRYEVRKLNAEKRPRMKGRFVKRITNI